MQTMREASSLNDESPVQDSNLERGSKDSAGKANQTIESVIEPAPREGTVRLDQIEIDGALQSREGLDDATITEYQRIASEAMEEGHPWPFPAVQLIGGRLVDGFHRTEAARRLGLREIPAVDRPGDRHDAIRAAVSANCNHGLRRSNADKRRAVLLAMETFPSLSNREVANLTKTSHTFVNQLRGGNVSTPEAEASGVEAQRTDFTRALESLRPGDHLMQGQDPKRDWTSIQRHAEGFRILRLIENQALEINVRDAQQVEHALHATDRDYSMAAGIQPFVILAA